VARAVSGIIFENQGVFLKICGPRLDFGQVQGVLRKVLGIYFPMKNPVDRFHDAWTGWHGSGPRWTKASQMRGRSGALPVYDVWALGLASA
jgi:hypothetical protein